MLAFAQLRLAPTLTCVHFASLLVALACWQLPVRATDQNDAKIEICLDVLNQSLIEFYLPSVDHKNGGYLEVLDANGKFVASEKFLTLQARQVWFFSTLANNNIRREESLAAAKSGFDFLTTKFQDREKGGYYAKVSASGEIVDSRKHVYPNAFVIYGLVEYFRASQDPSALKLAKELFQVLEEHCYDHEHGGYNEFFYADWKLITDPSEAGYVGAINTKTYNSHLHILEAFAQLYRETQDPLVAERLKELIGTNMNKVKHPEHPCNIDGWYSDWKMIESKQNLRASYGHDVECAWLVLDAVEALGERFPNKTSVESWARSITDFAIRFGFDTQHGGFYSSGEPAQASDDRRKIWWVQSEALVAMLTLHQVTRDQRYFEIFDQCFEFTMQHHVAPQGGWWDTLEEDGSVGSKKTRTSMWQGAYHNGRALLKCAKLLESN